MIENSLTPTFDFFWEHIIYPSIKRCVYEMDDKLKEEIYFEYKEMDDYKEELRDMFKRKREWLKREYLPNKREKAILDFHKLGAVLGRCIIGNKPFKFNMQQTEELFIRITSKKELSDDEKLNIQVNNIYINYKCAFLVCVGVSYIDLLYWANEKIKNEESVEKRSIYIEFLNRLKNEQNFIKYKKSDNHDDYETSMIVSFMKNDILMRDFDYLAIAASMFQWQSHTKISIFIDILSNNSGQYSIKNINEFI